MQGIGECCPVSGAQGVIPCTNCSLKCDCEDCALPALPWSLRQPDARKGSKDQGPACRATERQVHLRYADIDEAWSMEPGAAAVHVSVEAYMPPVNILPNSTLVSQSGLAVCQYSASHQTCAWLTTTSQF